MVDTLDLSGTSRVPLARLVGVELRKARDTRAGFWLSSRSSASSSWCSASRWV